MLPHTIKVHKTAHYYTLGRPGKNIKYCWFVCHGYGQLAKNFIRRFDVIGAEDTLIVAPEGFSRFYWKDFSGDVGASWMTREDRLDEISDYCNFLITVYDRIIPKLSEDVTIVLMGFSQGCATQLRWIMREFPHFHHLVLWAGLVPEDLDYLPAQAYFANKTIHFIYGAEDEFLTKERMQKYQQLIAEQKLKLNIRTFPGNHMVQREALQQLGTDIRTGLLQ